MNDNNFKVNGNVKYHIKKEMDTVINISFYSIRLIEDIKPISQKQEDKDLSAN